MFVEYILKIKVNRQVEVEIIYRTCNFVTMATGSVNRWPNMPFLCLIDIIFQEHENILR